MIKKLLFVFLLACSLSSKSQVVFCPPGAEWHYIRSAGAESLYKWDLNEAIKFARDTIIGTITAKVITHSVFFIQNTVPCTITLIKQIGDTVFMRNQITQHTWQILYNFNVTAGQNWYTTLLDNSSPSNIITYTTTVDSVKYVTVNNLTLKKVYARSLEGTDPNISGRPIIITERYGSNHFLFDFNVFSYFQYDEITSFLCYQDSTFGLKQFTSKPCYPYLAGVDELKGKEEAFMIYPNPAADILRVNLSGELRVIDIYSREVKRLEIVENNNISVSNLSPGIYFVYLYQNNHLVYKDKLVKE